MICILLCISHKYIIACVSNLFVKLEKWEANYGNDIFWGPWSECPLATSMMLRQLHGIVLVLDNDY